MIIRTNVPPKKVKVDKESAIVEKEKTVLVNEKPKKKKNIPTPIIEESIVEAVEEKTEDEDLGKWLEEHTED